MELLGCLFSRNGGSEQYRGVDFYPAENPTGKIMTQHNVPK
jgi:hypothetical protein